MDVGILEFGLYSVDVNEVRGIHGCRNSRIWIIFCRC